MSDTSRAHARIRRWFDAAVEIVEPRRAVVSELSLEGDALHVDREAISPSRDGRVVVIAIGKAAAGMARGARDVLGDRMDSGIILTKYGHLPGGVPGFDAFEAGHPVPDTNSLSGTQAILRVVEDLTEEDVVLALVSGGGSALLELPVDGVSLDDMRETTRLLMHAGAGIHDLNAVRTTLSRVKGGGLRRAIGPARCVTLLLSDVLGNDPAIIASGPTVIPQKPGADASRIIDEFGVRRELPTAVIDAIERRNGTAEHLDTRGDVVSFIADNAVFVDEIVRAAQEERLTVLRDSSPYDGDAAELGRELVRVAREASAGTDVIVRGGEATVAVTGDGTGGRNTEMALSAAMALQGDEEWIIASLASDGDDGNSEAAGAIADGGTVARALDAGIDPALALERNDSATVFRHAGGLVETGPTGANVNDVYIAVRIAALERTAKG